MMTDGAGKGPGLKGAGSQHAGEGESTGDATPGSGTVSETGKPEENAAVGVGGGRVGGDDVAPLVVGLLVVLFTFGGTLLL